MDEALIKAKVDEYVEWDNLLSAAKKEIEKLKVDFQKLALEAMSDKKVKQVEFWGNDNGKVVVTTTETLKLVSYHFLLKTIGEVLLKDFAKEETQYKLSEPFKRLLTAIFQGSYIEQPLDAVLDQIGVDELTRKTLKKKLKGNWEKDVKSLKTIAGLDEKAAEHFAYFVQEAVNYGKIVHLLEAAGYQRDNEAFTAALESIRHAVVVEENIKIGLECEEAV